MTINTHLSDREPPDGELTPTPTEQTNGDPMVLSRWHDPIIDQLGFDPRSRYVERFWLGTLGPSTVLLVRLGADLLDAAGEQVEVDLYEIAARLGIGHRGGRNSPLRRTLNRACRFGAARFVGRDELELRFRMAPLNRTQVERLPHDVQADHDRWLKRQLDHPIQERGRARRLALSLLECGDGFDEAERQLMSWRVSEIAAVEAVNWAWNRHCQAANSTGGEVSSEE